jgi:NAD+ synthetase
MASTLNMDFDWKNADIVMQNIQSRLRGMILMALTNNSTNNSSINPRVIRRCKNQNLRNLGPALLITTGNKSEYATGYATIYGDMNGAFNPIKDIYKTEVFKLARWRNSESGFKKDGGDNIIPLSIIKKAPSAELTSNQKDNDSLPDYEILDKILEMYIEQDLSLEEISKKYPAEIVRKVVKLVNIAEFKRQQSAPGVKISSKAFNLDRRYPLTNSYKI